MALAKERNPTELVGRELGDVAATFESDLELGGSGLSKLTTDFLTLVAGRESQARCRGGKAGAPGQGGRVVSLEMVVKSVTLRS